MSNYSVLEVNILDSLLSEEAKSAFLWARALPELSDDRCAYRVEAFAREVESLGATIQCMISLASKGREISSVRQRDLFAFIMQRHAFFRFPGRQKAYRIAGV